MDSSKLAIFDPRLVQPKPAYAVKRGAASISGQSFQALTANASQHVYSAIIPSLSSCVDRSVVWHSSFYLGFVATYTAAPAAGSIVVTSGKDFALASYPLHRLASNISVSINDSSVQLNTQQCLNSLLRLADSHKSRSVASTPYLSDVFADTRSGAAAISNPYASYADSSDEQLGNGSFPFIYCGPTGAALSGNGNYISGGVTVNYINGVPVTTAAQVSYPIFVRYTVDENLLVSPFTFGASAADLTTALREITSIQMTAQMQSPSAARIVRQLNSDIAIGSVVYLNVGNSPFADSALQMTFLTPPATLALPDKNVCPYYEMQAYPFATSTQIAAGAKGTVRSNVISLSSIPDLLLIRVSPGSYASTDGDWCLPVQNISLQFDNASGLLSSVQQRTLYELSKKNGLSMPWLQWSGQAQLPSGTVQMSSGELVLAFGEDIQLFEGAAPGVAGQFSLSVQCDVWNYSGAAVAPTITLITISSGQFISSRGQSQRSTALLTEADVLGAERSEITSGDLHRMIGSGWADKLAGFASKAAQFYHQSKPAVSAVKSALASSDSASAKKVAEALAKVGYGARTGSGARSGARTGASRLEDRFD